MDEQQIEAEIADLRDQIKVRQDRVSELRKLLGHPHVVPVQVYYRYHSEYRDDYDWSDGWDKLEGAYRMLEGMSDHGECSPVGVEVGGHLFKYEELEAKYGHSWDDE